MVKNMYTYKAKVTKIVDGDTIDVDIDLGFYIRVTKRIRFSFINAPERYTDAGKQATSFLNSTIPVGSFVIIKTEIDKADKYGRVLAEIFTDENSISVNKTMIEKGYAEYY